MVDFYKVEGNSSVVRDANTGAIISINDIEYKDHARKRSTILTMRSQIKKQEEDIADIREDISDIKNMLQQILRGIHAS